jgi:hypothetical protein
LLLYSSYLPLGISQLAGHLLHQLHANKFFGTIHHRAIYSNQTSMMLCLGGVVRRRFGEGRGLMDSRRAEALSGVMVTLTAGKTKIILIFILKIARRFEGGDGFCSVRMRCSLRTY